MRLNLKGFSQLVQDMGATLQSSGSTLIDISVGSVVRAIFEANASVVLWLQWLILNVLRTTRASTSQGTDLDSWMLDFGQIRLPSTSSTGIVTFSRFSANLPATVPIGTIVKTADGSTSFAVTEDRNLSSWQPAGSGYIIPAGVTSVDLPIACAVGGSVGNVLASMITVIAASLPGIDQISNANPLSNGADAESDTDFRARFQNYLASLSRATLTAVINAIANVRQGLDVAVAENTDANGVAQTGSFAVVVDDGTGFPSSGLLSAVASAIDSVRPVGTRFSVSAPQVHTVAVSLAATVAGAAPSDGVAESIRNYVSSYLNCLPIGRGASITRIAQNAYLAGPAVGNITGVLLNGSPLDFVPPPFSVIKAGPIVVTTNDR